MFHAKTLAEHYQPRPGDAPFGVFHVRMQACTRCALRHGHECSLQRQLCTIQARPADAICPNLSWPGDVAHIQRAALAVAAPVKLDIFIPQARRTPLRVGLLSPAWATGGLERWWLSLCRCWCEGDSIRPSGIALSDKCPTDQRTVDEALRYAPVLGSVLLSDDGRNAAEGIVRLANGDAAVAELKNRSDILISWADRDLGRHVKGFDGPIILVAHGIGQWAKDCMASSYRYATHLVAVGGHTRDAFPAKVRNRVVTIRNGIELDRCTPRQSRDAARAALGIPEGVTAIGYVGRFAADKNPLAAAEAASQIDGAVAVYACPASNHAEIIRDVARRLPADRTIILEPEHVGDVYGALDCYMAAAHEEAFGLAIFEAMAAGVPIVATPCGEIPAAEALHGPLVERVPPRPTPEQLAAAIIRATAPEMEERKNRARAAAWTDYSAGRMAEKWKRFLLAAAVEWQHRADISTS